MRACDSRHRRSRGRWTRGLTLVEVLVAIFVVSVGILGTLSAIWYGIRSERYAERRTTAVFVCRELMNLIRSRNEPFNTGTFPALGSPLNDGNYDDDGDDNGPKRLLNDPPFGNDFSGAENFRRRIEMKRLSTDPNNHLSDLAAIKVTVFWNEGASEKRVTLWAYHKDPD